MRWQANNKFLSKCRSLIVCVLLGLFGFTGTYAQQYDLDGYLQLLQENSLVIQQSARQVAMSEYDVRSAKSALLPSAGGELSYQRDFTKNFLFLNEEDPTGFIPSKFRTNFDNNIIASVVAEQTIYNPAATSTFKLALLAEELVRRTHRDLSETLKSEGTQLFWQAVFARESLEIFEENKELAEAQWRQMQDLFDQGYASELQVHQAESFYLRTLPQLQNAENTLEIILNEMRTLAGIPLDFPLELHGQISITPEEFVATEMQDSSLMENSQMRVLFQQARIAERQIATSNAARLPVATARLGFNFDAQDNDFKFENSNKLFFGQIGIQVPIFAGGYNTAQVQKAIIEKENATLEIANQRLTLQKELRNAWLNLQTAKEKIEDEQQVMRLSEKELEIARASQELGLLTPLELREMRLGLTEARLRLLNAHLDCRIAQLQMARILGNK